MPGSDSRKYQRSIELIKNLVGADIDRGVLETAISEIDVEDVPVSNTPNSPLFTSLDYVSGQELSAVDIAARIEALTGALKSNDGDEIVARITGSNGSEIADQSLDTDVANTDEALLTFVARALQTSSQDEIRSRLHNSSGTQIDPATVALEAALKSNDTDEFVSRISDSTGAEIDPATTALENALKSNDTDQFVSRIAGTDGLEVEEDELGNEISPSAVALVTYLARALESQLKDSLRSATVSDSEARFKHDDKTIPSGDSWYIPSGEEWRAGSVTLGGTLAVEGQVHTTGGISGDGTVTGSGTITLTSYT